MARYRLFMLKVPVNNDKPNQPLVVLVVVFCLKCYWPLCGRTVCLWSVDPQGIGSGSHRGFYMLSGSFLHCLPCLSTASVYNLLYLLTLWTCIITFIKVIFFNKSLWLTG